MNGGQLTPTSQHSVPSPADDPTTGSGTGSTGGRSTTGSSAKSGGSSPAHFLSSLANNNNNIVPAHLNNHHLQRPSVSSSAAEAGAVVSCIDDETDRSPSSSPHHGVSSQLLSKQPVGSLVAAMHQVLQGGASPRCSATEAAQLIQLSDLTSCLHSLLDLHKKVFHLFLFVLKERDSLRGVLKMVMNRFSGS